MGTPDAFRHELKYICSQGDLTVLEHRLQKLLLPDPHAGPQGTYHIRSIYFDDPFDRCVRENLAGVSHREKWRIRAYNCSPDRISLECKTKEHDMIHKDSCPLTPEQFRLLRAGLPCPVTAQTPPLLNRFSCLIRTQGFAPKVIVGYDRRPYVYSVGAVRGGGAAVRNTGTPPSICRPGNVRITFDCHIFSSPDLDGFFSAELRRRPVQLTGQHLLEVKFDEYLPDFIRQSIQMSSMQQTAFSKYFLCRKFPVLSARTPAGRLPGAEFSHMNRR